MRTSDELQNMTSAIQLLRDSWSDRDGLYAALADLRDNISRRLNPTDADETRDMSMLIATFYCVKDKMIKRDREITWFDKTNASLARVRLRARR